MRTTDLMEMVRQWELFLAILSNQLPSELPASKTDRPPARSPEEALARAHEVQVEAAEVREKARTSATVMAGAARATFEVGLLFKLRSSMPTPRL